MSEPSECAEASQRGIKRVRQACFNCRRKKVRCSGEKPACSFCVRLNQECQYLGDNHWVPGERAGHGQSVSSDTQDLLARLNSLEATVSQLSSINRFIPSLLKALAQQTPAPNQPFFFPAPGSSVPSNKSQYVGAGSPQISQQSPFKHLPPQAVLENACNTFFERCYNQPYAFFNEAKFRQRLEARTWPHYLLFSFLASAMRYSTDQYFENKHAEAREGYAATAWELIISSGSAVEEDDDPAIVQALSLLAIIDSAAGRRRAAWVKIGLAVRISQDLGLAMEPDSHLPIQEQEERRRTFWSLYLCDRFVSCSRNRPSAIIDGDCQIRLPCSESNFRRELPQDTEFFNAIDTGNETASYKPDQLALLVVTARTLGRCSRYLLDSHSEVQATSPWNPKSEYAAINSTLLGYESYLEMNIPLKEYITNHIGSSGEPAEREPTSHVIFSRMIFHLCHCLLNHPFLLRMRVAASTAKAPSTWYSAALKSGLDHAVRLSTVFGTAGQVGFSPSTSFYGYALLVAGTIHALYTHTDDEALSQMAANNFNLILQYLDGITQHYNNAKSIANGLRYFWSISSKFSHLLRLDSLSTSLEEAELNILWSIVDYGIVSVSTSSLSRTAKNAVAHRAVGAPQRERDDQGPNLDPDTIDMRESPYSGCQASDPRIAEGPFSMAADGLSVQHFGIFAESQIDDDFIHGGDHNFFMMSDDAFNGLR